MNKLSWILYSVLIYCLLSGAHANPIEDPQQVVKQTTEAVLSEIGSRKAELEANPTLIYPLVERTMTPRFDAERFTRSAMGRFWRKATQEQQAAIIHEFKQLLMRTYALSLLNYSGQKIDYLPTRRRADTNKALVQTQFHFNGQTIPINYRMVLAKREAQDKWLVYDVIIDGISLITNYRSIFNNRIREGAGKAQNPADRIRVGIDHLIDTLKGKNADNTPS
jgi:phospholipid transport system substrate-binding protein